MKENSQKILLSLYSEEPEVFFTTPQSLELLVPKLSLAGRRSLLGLLVREGYLLAEKVGGVTHLQLTQHGRMAVQAQFPVFHQRWQSWQGEWSCLVFVAAPKSDPEFRYLRRLLVDQGSLVLSRGVYLYPGGFPERIMAECQSSYVLSVVIFGIKDWEFGDERRVIGSYYRLTDVTNTYSGLSKEIERVLNKKNEQKGLIDPTNDQKLLLFEKLFAVFKDDPGLTKFYFPQVGEPIKYLQAWQQMLKL